MNTVVIGVNFERKNYSIKFFAGAKCWQKAQQHLDDQYKKNEKDWHYLLYRDAEANKEWADYVLGNADARRKEIEEKQRKRGQDDKAHKKAE